jgi:Uri superfamily endonuclease
LPIPGLTDEERGAYVLLVSLGQDRTITIGRLGNIDFKAGTYVYCGSAMAGYRGRVGRHFSRDKKMHWHIDYLLEEAEPVCALLVPASAGVECSLGRLLSGLDGSEPVNGFGCSDCSCRSHLYRIDESAIPEMMGKIRTTYLMKGRSPENH